MAGYSDNHHLDRFDHHHDEGIIVTSSPHDKIHLDGDELLSPHHIITLKCIGILVMIGQLASSLYCGSALYCDNALFCDSVLFCDSGLY